MQGGQKGGREGRSTSGAGGAWLTGHGEASVECQASRRADLTSLAVKSRAHAQIKSPRSPMTSFANSSR